MHQTFYIDIDEEITSIVDRLKKAKAEEIVIVVPKRALIIQSLVNLKLLKKEAENMGLRVMVVTQDKLGKMLVEKAGILVQDRLDDTLDDNVIYEGEENGVIKEVPAEKVTEENLSARARVRDIGSEGYFDERTVQNKKEISRKTKAAAESIGVEKLTNKELVLGMERNNKSIIKRAFSGKKKSASLDLRRAKKPEVFEIPEERDLAENRQEEKRLESFFKGEERREGRRSEMYRLPKEIKIPSKFWKKFIFFGLILLIAGGILAGYLFLPKATVAISTKGKIQAIDAEVKGEASLSQIDYESEAIPAKVISTEEELSKSFDVSGKKSVSNQKASGTVTIYNEYSSNSQPLVSTTRFEAPDGKIFRLKKSISVPGTTKVDGETKPGAIEAEVVADEPGERYNIGPSTFTIPGFKDSGNDKFNKFYAKSFNPMTGGGSGSADVKTVQVSDIETAKNKMLEEIASVLKDKIKTAAGEGYEIPEEAINIGNAEYKVSNSAGEISQNFTISLKAKANALAVKKQDLQDILAKIIMKRGGFEKISENSLAYEFGKTDADFNDNALLIRIHATAKVASGLNTEELKQGILGKNEEQVKNFLGTYPEITNFSVVYWPSFISGRIPIYGKRVEIKLDNN